MPNDTGARPQRQGAKEVRVSKSPQKVKVHRSKDGTHSLEGYFCTYQTLSHDLGGFKERLAPGCFDKSLRQQPMTALVNHDESKLLARSGQNLTVTSDSTGLKFRVKPLPQTSYSQDLVSLAENGLVDSCSFGFYCVDDDWSTLPDGTPLRTIREAIVLEGSILAGPDPAYPQTSVSVRAQRRAKANRDGIDSYEIDCDEDELDDDGNCPEDEEQNSRKDECTTPDPELDTLRLRLKIATHRAKRFSK